MRGVAIAVATVLVIAGLGLMAYLALLRNPVRALNRFYTYDARDSFTTEDQLMDPLILAGESVVPTVIREIRNPAMPKRRYAIGFLGNGGYEQALPALREIVSDSHEAELIRADGLSAIEQIDEREGRLLASRFSTQKDFLGEVARSVLAGDRVERRTFLQALRGSHD